MAELSWYNQTIMDEQAGNPIGILLIPFLAEWLWINHFTSLSLMFLLWWIKVEYLYTCSPYFTGFSGGCSFILVCKYCTLQITKDCIHVASYYPSFKNYYLGLGRKSEALGTLLLLVCCAQAQLSCYSKALDPRWAFPRPRLSQYLGTVPGFSRNYRGNVNQWAAILDC